MKKAFERMISGVLCVSISLTGCSFLQSSTETLTVTSDVRDAEIYINGSLAGKGTAAMDVKRNEDASVLVKKDGYIPMQRSVGKSLSITGILDIIGGFIFLAPFFGLLAPGAFDLDQKNVVVTMVRE